jgi:membrane-associated phospholipid phosphatase
VAHLPRILEAIRGWDARIIRAVTRRRRRPLSWVLVPATYSGAGLAWLFALLLLWTSQSAGVTVIADTVLFLRCMWASLASLLIGAVIKRVIRRRRPFVALEDVTRAVWVPDTRHSFPSTHASTSVALAVALAIAGHGLWPWLSAWASVVVFSRLYLGVHFPSDLAAGALLGTLCAIALAPWV